jgi:hypothetical protein
VDINLAGPGILIYSVNLLYSLRSIGYKSYEYSTGLESIYFAVLVCHP